MLNNAALLVVDVQNDFCEDGALAVPNASKIIPTINDQIHRFLVEDRPIIVTRCWHPADTQEHFKTWPPHCVQDTDGARFHPDLYVPSNAFILSKGMQRHEDAYSAFNAFTGSLSLNALLAAMQIDTLVVQGIATEYCIKATVDDALRRGHPVTIYSSGIASISPETGALAISEMIANGAAYVGWTMGD